MSREMQVLLDRFRRQARAVGAILDVRYGDRHWAYASGCLDADTGEALTPEATFRLASITKMVTAAALLRLVEHGQVDLSAPLAGYLPEPVTARLTERFGRRCATAPVARVLNHTAGLPDYATDPRCRAVLDAPPPRNWTAEQIIDLAVTRCPTGGLPIGEFHYTDTGYVLIGMVLRRCTGLPLAAALRGLAGLGDLRLRHTYLEGHEPVPPGTPGRVHQYLDGADCYGADVSWDSHGCGGLVSTAAELATFVRHLFDGDTLGPAALAAMLDARVDTGRDGLRAGLGVFRGETEAGIWYGHHGFWSSWVHHYPGSGLTITASLTSVPVDEAQRSAFEAELARIVTGSSTATPATDDCR